MTIGSISEAISEIDDINLLKKLGVNDSNYATKNRILFSVRDSDSRIRKATRSYSNGASVKGLVVNISGRYVLKLKEKKHESGKSWSDSKVLIPDSEIKPCRCNSFFHTKHDGATTGTRAGFSYEILDPCGNTKGTISIAWNSPEDLASSDFTSCILVSRTRNLLQECLNWCSEANEDKLGVDASLCSDTELDPFFDISVVEEDDASSYLIVSIKTNDLVEKLLEANC